MMMWAFLFHSSLFRVRWSRHFPDKSPARFGPKMTLSLLQGGKILNPRQDELKRMPTINNLYPDALTAWV